MVHEIQLTFNFMGQMISAATIKIPLIVRSLKASY